MQNSFSPSPRITMVDALRGFAVLAILLVHNLEHFIFPIYPTASPAWLDILDQGMHHTVFALFAGKAYAIFALLFGLTFHIQSSNMARRGGDFGYRFLWRMVMLAGFAAVNAAFFPAGDVLLLFAVVSLVLFFTRKWSDRAIFCASVFFLLQPIEWYHYVAYVINPSHQLPDLQVGKMYTEVANYTMAGDFSDFILCNITLGQKASFLWAVNAGRLCQTAGLFLFGCYIGRKQLFISRAEDITTPQAATKADSNVRLWTYILVISSMAFCPLHAIEEQVMLAAKQQPVIGQSVGTVLDMWQKLAFTFVLISSFVMLYQSVKFRSITARLRYYGRMSLTNYITQSIIGAFIYFPFGLYLAPYCGATLSLLIGLGVFLLQTAFCRWWLSGHKQGPLETIWHKWTWIGGDK